MGTRSGIAFVVLHYNAYNETINCVNSILKNVRTDHIKIIVVDNCSPNGSGENIKNSFVNDDRVYYIGLDKNIGFAGGNNVGINYARDNLGFEFVCCINNDTIVEQIDFFERVLDTYYRTNAAVIGPKVYLKNGSYQPFNTKLETTSYYQKQIKRYRKGIVLLRVKNALERLGIKNITFNKHNRAGINKGNGQETSYYETEHKDVILHGCCLIFTPIFFHHLKGFASETFLYREEEILYIDIRNKNLHNIYSPDVYILHLEDAATNSLFNNNIKKEIFVLNNKIASTKVLIKHMQSQK